MNEAINHYAQAANAAQQTLMDLSSSNKVLKNEVISLLSQNAILQQSNHQLPRHINALVYGAATTQ